MTVPTVTIGRENGSGGREVGRILAGILGVKCYDREIIARTAEVSGMDEGSVEAMEESERGGRISYWGVPPANPLFGAQCRVIADLASEGPCVFVGRCADHVLSGRDDVVRVFIDAPLGDRISRSSERNGISGKEAYERIRDTDAQRAAYYQRYTGKVWGSAQNYDITLSTGRIGVEGAAKLIAEYIGMAYPGP